MEPCHPLPCLPSKPSKTQVSRNAVNPSPVLNRPPPAPTPVGSPGANWSGEGRILVVEDDFAVRTLVERVLLKRGFTVSAAANGTQAVNLVKAAPEQFILALVDLKLPGMGPADIVREIRSLIPRLPVVAMTGYARDRAIDRMEGVFFNGYLSKPFTLNTLSEEIRKNLKA